MTKQNDKTAAAKNTKTTKDDAERHAAAATAGIGSPPADVTAETKAAVESFMNDTPEELAEKAAAARSTLKEESKAFRMKALIKLLNKATRAANVEYRATMKALGETKTTTTGENATARARWNELKAIIKAAKAEMEAIRPNVKGDHSDLAAFIKARKEAQERRDNAITAAMVFFNIAQSELNK